MYGGELCYWYQQALEKGKISSSNIQRHLQQTDIPNESGPLDQNSMLENNEESIHPREEINNKDTSPNTDSNYNSIGSSKGEMDSDDIKLNIKSVVACGNDVTGKILSDGIIKSNKDFSGCEEHVLNCREKGVQFLDLYIKAIKGPLQGQGWDTKRAQELLQYLKPSISSS